MKHNPSDPNRTGASGKSGNRPGEALGAKKNMPLGDETETDMDAPDAGRMAQQKGAGSAGQTATQARQQTGQQTAGTSSTTMGDKGKNQPPTSGKR
jgi:hypothetical protein